MASKNKFTTLPFVTLGVLFFLSTVFYFNCQLFNKDSSVQKVNLQPVQGQKIAAFAEGCFWCSEHIFESIPGVTDVISGYAGGHTKNPTYELVNTETTGHAETVLVYYDPSKIDYAELCRIFFLSHDPTTPNRQGPDEGSSYRSILFYGTEEERIIAKKIQEEIKGKQIWKNPIVTEYQELKEFYSAENYNQNFIQNNPNQSYVRAVSMPRYVEFQSKYELYKKTMK
ncbi:peptide-methionine (S)-S-oxide reductase MsrA [Leptospira kanakyensis]|uniref:Peptide methionine sulfoxide reductase MsrA n=1 Tax=Leptospira kanakyensis TaxID=2484968 RepID=A0A6N4Q808_9LEPT|nr:peptide-methionine (S)-S-oxide reductase MsrA [Leptospira kanakyensis]MCW7468311.1 peptide-methionine (S)-S-oxide reductase MsrA [Leptospira kanakyensis]TGK55390.1 peptide-methionine (S)-S-oxide reductase [Leptospira kanakyensis]TGK60924.1 peptide-methionine (S)-S-oxide reductase [Leptospira kanakyensis]TGK76602.1 peptide-methionine (S)-S-oxide reductase [Leptospira kanakyensis]